MNNIKKISSMGSISDFLEMWITNDFLSLKNQKVLNKYYRSYVENFGAYIKKYYNEQTRELMNVIKADGDLNVLEVGCGCGTESLWMALHGANVVAIDIDGQFIEVANERKNIVEQNIPGELKLRFENVSLLELIPHQKFDIIWMEQAFHHLEPRNEIIKRLIDLLKPNGRIIFSESNAWNPLIQIWLYKFRGSNMIIKTGDHLQGNERIITPKSLCKLFQIEGFKVESYRYFRVFPNKAWADNLMELEKNAPQFLKPIFTHYNLVIQKS